MRLSQAFLCCMVYLCAILQLHIKTCFCYQEGLLFYGSLRMVDYYKGVTIYVAIFKTVFNRKTAKNH